MSSGVEPPPGNGPANFGPGDYVRVPRFEDQGALGLMFQPNDYVSVERFGSQRNASLNTEFFPESYYKALDKNDSVEIRADSHGGLGLFAKRTIRRGEVVGIYYNFVEIDRVTRNPYVYVLSWGGLDGKMYCPEDALDEHPDPTLPLNGNFINDAIDLDAFLAAIDSEDWNTMEACKIADDQSKSNAWIVHDKGKPTYCISKVDIEAGKEITIMYTSNYWFSHILHNPKFSVDLRIKSLMMLWTEYENSPGTIPVKDAWWLNLYGQFCTTPDAQASFPVLTEEILDTMWKKITGTFINCIVYVNFEQSSVLDVYIKAMIDAWHKILDDMAYRKGGIHLKTAKLPIDKFWFSVNLRKAQASQ